MTTPLQPCRCAVCGEVTGNDPTVDACPSCLLLMRQERETEPQHSAAVREWGRELMSMQPSLEAAGLTPLQASSVLSGIRTILTVDNLDWHLPRVRGFGLNVEQNGALITLLVHIRALPQFDQMVNARRAADLEAKRKGAQP
ncbi:hypothetical protein [Paraburkholderia humisilvae]|uniref:Uncharacterized protein n=1 Tax=Paraburkholderia humisilvae TaxID=627669 RepID=A0A6J5DYA5_9BURK|nr:hypothetical protein [Paraburkholderia humisilvae]CAB3758647.1 hypothetical protein LMG29542_03395 [Paraburkholderia humisilvae]